MSVHSVHLGHRQKGLSLIELMIASTIGLILLSGLFRVLISHKSSYGFQVSQAQLVNRVRLVNSVLVAALHKSGYWDELGMPESLADDRARKFGDLGGVFGADSSVFAMAGSGVSGPAINGGSDELWIRYKGSQGPVLRNCLGSQVNGDQLAIEHYFIAASAAGHDQFSLYCESTILAFNAMSGRVTHVDKPLSKQPIVSGIETLELRFAVQKGNKFQYRPATQITDWTAVKLIQFAFVMSSFSGKQERPASLGYFRKIVNLPRDNRRYQVFVGLAALKNS